MNSYLSFFDLDPKRIGGTEVFARELSVQLAESGWESVLCFRSEPCYAVRGLLNLPNVRLEILPRDGRPVFRTYRPAIFHSHYVGLGSTWPWFARFSGIRRIFVTDHASRPQGYVIRRRPAWKIARARVLTMPITNVIAVSDFGERCLRASRMVADDCIKRIYNGVDLQCSSAGARFRERLGICSGAAVVTHVSNMIREKGVEDFLRGAQIVLERQPGTRFVVVGDGPLRQEFQRKAEELGISHGIYWTGLLQDPVGDGLYAASDIVCLMSLWEELFGFVVAEAMAHQKPVIATRAGALPELVEDGVTGALVPPGDYQAMAGRTLEFLADPALRTRLGHAGRLAVAEKFDVRRNVARLLEVAAVGPR